MSVYTEIRSDIINGIFPPGEKLKLEDLRKQYNVGVSNLREALARLSGEGLVNAEDNKGFRTLGVNPARLEEITQMRLLVEYNGAEKSLEKGDLSWESGLIAAHHSLAHVEKRMNESGIMDTVLWTKYDYEFHLALIDACGSELNKEMLSQMFNLFRHFVVNELKSHGFRGTQIIKEHQAILEAALDRDKVKLKKAMEDHLCFYLNRLGGKE